MYYAYIYSDPVINLPFYVGKGTGRRAYQHLNKCHNPAVHNKIQKLKRENLKPFIDVIETSTEEFAFMLEKGLVKQYGRVDLKTGSLFNFTEGGEFTGAKKGRPAPNKGTKLSEERKKQMSIRMKGINAGIPVMRVSCLHCKKEGGLPAMTLNHFIKEKCKK